MKLTAFAAIALVVVACSAPTSVDSCPGVDGGATCDIAKHDLVCPGGGCVTDSTSCPGLTGCENQCASDEVAAACGGPSTSNAPPSASCRVMADLPSGTVIYCCKCN